MIKAESGGSRGGTQPPALQILNKKLSYRLETARRESLKKIAEIRCFSKCVHIFYSFWDTWRENDNLCWNDLQM